MGEKKEIIVTVTSPEEFYAAANLTGNPFRSNPTQVADPRRDIWVGYEREQAQLIKYLKRARADQVGNANFILLFGSYGTGKSHALLWAQNRILNKEAADYKAVCYFVPSIKKAKGQLTFAGAFVDDIVAKSKILADVQAYRNFLGGAIFRYREENEVAIEVPDDQIIEKIIPSVELYNFAKELFRCESADDFKRVICPKGMGDHDAVTIFTRIVNLFVHEVKLKNSVIRYKNAAYLFIDELDDLLRTTIKEARIVNDTLRHIYDACPNCFGLVIGASAQSAEFTAMFEDYVLTRIQKRIELHLLDKDDAKDFVIEIMDKSRRDPNGPKGAFPFEEAAIDAIASQLTEITPRKIVNTMQEVIEEIRLAGLNPKDKAIGLPELDQADVMEEVFGDGGIA